MNPNYIVVQAGGKGTRMDYLTRNKPKALVPINNLPILFHLFKKYPDKEFVIIGDYKYDVLKRYLNVFADVKYQLVCGSGYIGTCAGVRAAVDCLPENEPFMFIWSDLILPDDFTFPGKLGNYVGIAKDFPCRWQFKDGVFLEERSQEFGVAGLFLFENKKLLEQVPMEGEFVRWLSTQPFEIKEFPLYRTKEYGLISEYKKQSAGKKCRPFNRIISDGDIIIKEGIDAQGQNLAKRECAWYQMVMDKGFEQIPKIYSLSPLKMERIDGDNIYTYTSLLPEQKRNILSQIIDCLKKLQALGEVPSDYESYMDAYIGKTFNRLAKVAELVPFADKKRITVNGKSCRNVLFCREELEKKVKKYFPKTFKFIHGDCTFSNTLLRRDGVPVLIDPRGYFGNTELYGDPAYDWAKLYYSIVGNYDRFNLKEFSLDIRENDVQLDIQSNHWEDMESSFFELLGDEIVPEQIKLFHAIIWLSLTTYAWEDYDSICGAFYNGLLYLEEAL